MKTTLTLTENEFKDCLRKMITEISINAKKRNVANVKSAFEKGKSGYNAIKTFAVFTAENPDSQQASSADNRRFNKSLASDLKNGGYIVIPAYGKFGNTEHSFMVLNIDLDTCKRLCGKYEQTSFIYHILDKNGKQVISEYWEKADSNAPYHPQSNDYVKKDSEAKYVDEREADDFYTSIGRNLGKEFKYSIPFSIFNEMNEKINEKLQMIVENRVKRGFKETKEEIFEYAHRLNTKNAGNGMYRTAMRKAINKSVNEAVKRQPMHMWNGYVVLEHDSGTRIKNGIISNTGRQANHYSKNSDLGNYFWASEQKGKDPSNYGGYHYYCLVKPEQVYDIDKNPKKYNSTVEALEHEEYVAGQWYDGAIAVMTLHPTPISFIECEGTGSEISGIYDPKWHLLRTTSFIYNKQEMLSVARKMKPYQNIEVPEFLGGMTYSEVMEKIKSELQYY